MPPGEEAEDRNNRAGSQAASQKAWASCLSQPGSSGHVSTSCPQKTNQALCREFVCLRAGGNMASLHQQVAYFPALEFFLRGHPPSTFQKQGTVKGLTTLYSINWLSNGVLMRKWDARHATLWLGAAYINLNVFWYQPKCVHSTKHQKVTSPKSWQRTFWAHSLRFKLHYFLVFKFFSHFFLTMYSGTAACVHFWEAWLLVILKVSHTHAYIYKTYVTLQY